MIVAQAETVVFWDVDMLAIIAAIFLASVALIVYLIANPKTRPFGLVVGFIGFLFVVPAILFPMVAYRRAAISQPATLDPPPSSWVDLSNSFDNLTKPRIDLAEEADLPVAVEEPSPPAAAPIAIMAAQTRPAEKEPSWVTNPPKRIGNVDRRVVKIGPFATIEDCYKVLDLKLLEATGDYMQGLLGINSPPNGVMVQRMGIDSGFVRREICRDEYVKSIEASFGPMKEIYVLMEFSPTVDRELKNRWYAHRRQENMFGVALTSGSILGLLGLVFGLFQIDTWTKGYYTKRLFLGVPLTIIGVLALVALFG